MDTESLLAKPVETGSDAHLRQAADALDKAKDEFARAQTRLINAQERYNNATRAWSNRYFYRTLQSR